MISPVVFFVAILIIQQIHMNSFFCPQSVALESIIHPKEKAAKKFLPGFGVKRYLILKQMPRKAVPCESHGASAKVYFLH